MQRHVRNRAVQIGRICGNNLLFAFNFVIKTHITYRLSSSENSHKRQMQREQSAYLDENPCCYMGFANCEVRTPRQRASSFPRN